MTFRNLTSILTVVVICCLPISGFSEDSQGTTNTNTTTTTPNTTSTPASGTTTPTSDTSAPASNTTTTTPSTSAPANTTDSSAPSFQATCVNAWMGRNTEIKDPTDFKNFGEKYCKCAETQQPLDTQDAVNKAAQVCMARTLLHDAMDNVEAKIGLDKVSEKDIADSCHDRWSLVYPKMDDSDQKIASAYCDCADPKLLDLSKRSDKMTDDEYYKEINKIAATCSGKEGK